MSGFDAKARGRRPPGPRLAAGDVFGEAPRAEAYGQVVVFQDLYGNRWDLMEARGAG